MSLYILKVTTYLIVACLILSILYLLIPFPGNIQKEYLQSTLKTQVDRYLKEKDFQGVVLIAKDEDILIAEGYGYANLEHRVLNTADTVFHIGSITKEFTAVAILQLQERGLLNVHDPISKFIPNYPQGNKITIHHLLSHSAGIPSLTELPTLADIQRNPSTPQQVTDHFQNLPLRFTPGTDCEYSDSGPILLGIIIEIVTGQSYEEYLVEHIFKPLNMHTTFYAHNNAVIPSRASGYVYNDGVYGHPRHIDMSFPYASCALASTVGDLYRFNRSLTSNVLLSKHSLEALFSIQAANSNRKIYYGYGFRIGPQNRSMEGCEDSIVGHFGTIEGFEAASILYRKDGVVIVLLSNVEKTNVRLFHKELAALLRSSWRFNA